MSMAYIFWEAIIEAYVCVKESERVSTSGGLGALPLRALLSQETQHFPCSPKGYKPKPCPKVPLILLHPLWNVHLWVSESPSSCSSSLLQDLGYVVLCLCVVVQSNMCHVTLDYGGVQGGTRPKRVISLYLLQRSRNLQFSILGHSSAPITSHESVLC